MNTPVVLIIFNRPLLTQKVFEEIKKIKPEQLFIISDGPRNEDEKKTVEEARKVTEQVDWTCEVFKKYSDNNLGCRISVSSGLDWVFSQVDRAIILEDDCVPDPTFFKFCEELLWKYKDEKKIMMISGDNFFPKESKSSYDFCHHSLIWGWATWKRAWEQYQAAGTSKLNLFEKKRDELTQLVSGRRLDAIKKTLERKIDTWDYLWQYAMLLNHGLCIYPSVNLVKNIGFGSGATHTKYRTFHSSLSQKSVKFPLQHPGKIEANKSYDGAISKTYHPLYSFLDVILHLFR